MRTAFECRTKAEGMEALAASAASPRIRSEWIAMAETRRVVAHEAAWQDRYALGIASA